VAKKTPKAERVWILFPFNYVGFFFVFLYLLLHLWRNFCTSVGFCPFHVRCIPSWDHWEPSLHLLFLFATVTEFSVLLHLSNSAISRNRNFVDNKYNRPAKILPLRECSCRVIHEHNTHPSILIREEDTHDEKFPPSIAVDTCSSRNWRIPINDPC